MANLVNTPSVAKETNALLSSISNFIVYHSEIGKEIQASSHGLSVFLPVKYRYIENIDDYKKVIDS
jgi:hypothetical protein